MHRYQPRWPEDRSDREPPRPWDFVYRDARDIAKYASFDVSTTWRTSPEVWHLDDTGRWCCYSKGSSLDSVRRYAESPEDLVECRRFDTNDDCPDYWVVIEPRAPWSVECYEVTEDDARSFVELRSSLAPLGVSLLDVVIVHDDFRWWSLHELTCGTTAWTFEPPTSRTALRPRARPGTSSASPRANEPNRITPSGGCGIDPGRRR